MNATVAALRADPAFAPLRRSLDVYYGDAARDAAMDALYARFVRPGDLAFDIGSHVGDRIGELPPARRARGGAGAAAAVRARHPRASTPATLT